MQTIKNDLSLYDREVKLRGKRQGAEKNCDGDYNSSTTTL
jgi:hypothetical protein